MLQSTSVRTLLLALVAGVFISGVVNAQSPRMGPDSGTFKSTMTSNTSSAIMGMTMEIGMEMLMIQKVNVTAAGRDTLRMKTRLDSIAFKMTGPMASMLSGTDLQDAMPIKKGDTSVVLVSTSGSVLKQEVGSAGMQLPFSGTEGLPQNLTPGATWKVNPPQMSADMPGSPGAAEIMKPMLDAMKDATTMTYVGVVDHLGTRAWKFTMATDAKNMSIPLGSTGMTATMKEMTGAGEMFIDLNGRPLLFDYNQTGVMEMNMEGTPVQSTSKTTIRFERVR